MGPRGTGAGAERAGSVGADVEPEDTGTEVDPADLDAGAFFAVAFERGIM